MIRIWSCIYKHEKRVYELFLSSHHKEIQLQNLKILYRIRSKQDRKPHVLTYISWYKNGLLYKMQINAHSLAKCTELNCFGKTNFVPQKILNLPVKAEDKFKYLLSPVFYQMFWNLLLILCRTYSISDCFSTSSCLQTGSSPASSLRYSHRVNNYI